VQLLRKQIRIENADKKFLIEHIKKGQSGRAASVAGEEGLDDNSELRVAGLAGESRRMSRQEKDKMTTVHHLPKTALRQKREDAKEDKKNKKKAIGSYANPQMKIRT